MVHKTRLIKAAFILHCWALSLFWPTMATANLDSLYEYMATRLVDANVQNEIAPLDEVAGLLRNVKAGWDAIAE